MKHEETGMKLATMVIAMILLTPGAAAAAVANNPPPDQDSNDGWFSPTFTNSPVNLVLCTVPGACVLHGIESVPRS
jgi:hypothetical protein